MSLAHEAYTEQGGSDPRARTFEERLRIGFDGVKERWREAEAEVDRDKLVILGHPVMERWEDGYMRTLAGIAAKNGGRVLEVGYGMGISAGHLQDRPISEHWIIEANAAVADAARAFAATAKAPVKVLQGFWEDEVAKLPSGQFDGILFDTYPLVPGEVHKNHFPFFVEAKRLLKPGGVLTYYSDEIDGFSPDHLEALRQAGFRKIDGVVCEVRPPADCRYWTSNTILAPIVINE